MSDGPPEEVILRKFVYGVADADGDVDVLTAVEQAIDRVNELEAEQAALQERVDRLQRVQESQPTAGPGVPSDE